MAENPIKNQVMYEPGQGEFSFVQY